MERTFTKADWDRYAECYDALEQLYPYARMLDEVTEALQDADGLVLDAGCGTGNLATKLVQKSRVVGIDASMAMLKRAKEKCLNAEFLQADLNVRLSFVDHTFGALACVNALYALAHPVRTLREFFRVLRPGGRLVATTPKSDFENGLILKSHCESMKPDAYWQNAHASTKRERLLISEALPDVALASRFIQIARFNRKIAREQSFRFFTAKELSDIARKIGFIGVRVGLAYADQNLLLVANRPKMESKKNRGVP